MAAVSSDGRFTDPLYTMSEAARIIDVPRKTFALWARGDARRGGGPIVTWLRPERPRFPSIPFIGLAEATVLAAIRQSGVPMQRVRPALQVLEKEIGLRHALASQKLYVDGAEVLYDFSQEHPDTEAGKAARSLVVVRNRQCVYTEIVEEYLRCLTYALDGYVQLMRVPVYRRAEVVVDPSRSGGDPIFARGGCRVRDVLQRFWAGDSLKRLTQEFGAPRAHIEDALRVASRRASPAFS